MIDLILIILFILYVVADSRRGFLRLFSDLIGMILAFFLSLTLYLPLSSFASSFWKNENVNFEALSFLFLWLVLQGVFFALSKIVSYYTPVTIKDSKVNRYLAYLPAFLKGVVFILVLVILIIVAPMPAGVKNYFDKSYIVNFTSSYALSFQKGLQQLFFGTLSAASKNQTLIKDETIELKYKTSDMSVDIVAEQKILTKINEERRKVGVGPLVLDKTILGVARAHSKDMLENGYFSHVAKDGRTLADRLYGANIDFIEAAENIATAPTPELVHLGLMNSQKHKDNILNPVFTRVGIGVMNAGQYGLMVTEDFAK